MHYTPCTSSLSIAQNDANQAIKVYPNPTSQLLYIDIPNGESMRIELTNSLGQKLWSGSNVNQIDLSTFQSGLYFLELSSQTTKQRVKVIKR